MYYILFCFFCLSSGRRHTSCALVTGVQTCALPISRGDQIGEGDIAQTTPSLSRRLPAVLCGHAGTPDFAPGMFEFLPDRLRDRVTRAPHRFGIDPIELRCHEHLARQTDRLGNE